MAAGARPSPRPVIPPGVGCQRACIASLLLLVTLPGRAEPPDPTRIAAAWATAVQRDGDSLRVNADVTAQRLRLGPAGAPALAPDGRVMNELAAVQTRVWLSNGRTAWSVGVGTIGYLQSAPGLHADGPVTLAGASPAVSVGMRYRMTHESAFFADALGARALPPDTGNYLSTKVGMEWKPAKSQFGFEGGALGIHLDSGYKLSLKARHDGLGVFLRGQF